MALRDKGFTFVGGPKAQVDKLLQQNKPNQIRTYVGSSAGAFVASILAGGYSLESLINSFRLGSGEDAYFDKGDLQDLKPFGYRHIFSINSTGLLKFIPEGLFRRSVVTGGFETMIKNGLKLNGFFSTEGVEKFLRKDALVVNEFAQLGVELFVIGTQLNHSRKVIFGNFSETWKTETNMYVHYASISEAVACSAALPPVFKPYVLKRPDGKEMSFYDGEIRETLSAHVAADAGCDLVISSYSVQPYHYTDAMGSLDRFGIPVIINQALYQVIQQKIEKHIQSQNDISRIYHWIANELQRLRIPQEEAQDILARFRKEYQFRPEVEYLYIHPRPTNYDMFFVDHFSLSPEILEKIVAEGFRSAIQSLRHRPT